MHAQAATVAAVEEAEKVLINGKEIDKAQAQALVDMLQDDKARQAFTDNLKTLIDTQPESNTIPSTGDETFDALLDPFDNSSALSTGIEEQSQTLTTRYEAFLERNNLSRTKVGQAAMSGMSLILLSVMLVLMRKIGGYLKGKLRALQIKFSLHRGRIDTYFLVLGWLVALTLICGNLFFNAMVWGITDIVSVKTSVVYVVIDQLLHLLLIVMLGISVFEIASGGIEYALCKSSKTNTNRVKTLLPILRTIAFVVISVLFLLVLLSEIGINIMPMLAGAGVAGIAVGFGAQTLVKDYLTGFTILMEDLIRVGDVAMIGDESGAVERLTLRKVQLRNDTGTVITVPYSEIKIIHNMTKDFSFYVLEVPIAYRQDTDEVIAIMRKVDEEMRADPAYGHLILDKLEVLGVDRFTDASAIIKSRIKTLPVQQWNVGREFNARFKKAFVENNIEIAIPKPTVIVKTDDGDFETEAKTSTDAKAPKDSVLKKAVNDEA